jgi:predicted CopG family antitoxin
MNAVSSGMNFDDPSRTLTFIPLHTVLCIRMPTRTISLDEEAYERLKAHKRGDESFSDVVKRLAGERSWKEVTGILTDEEADALEDAIDEGRARSRERGDRLARELDEAVESNG